MKQRSDARRRLASQGTRVGAGRRVRSGSCRDNGGRDTAVGVSPAPVPVGRPPAPAAAELYPSRPAAADRSGSPGPSTGRSRTPFP